MHNHSDDRMDRHFERVFRKIEAARQRGWGGFGGPGRGWGGPGGPGPGPGGPGGRGGWGEWGDWGASFRIGRMLASGDLRLIALYFIELQPRHGYDLIKAIEEKTGGIYSPSPGVIYPALTFLEEAGYVTSTAEGNKRLYTITPEGKTYLSANREAVEGTLAHLGKVGEQFGKLRAKWEEMQHGPESHDHGPRPDRDMDDVEPAVNDARRDLKDAIKQAARDRSPESQRRLADILRHAAAEIRRGGPAPEPEPDIDL